MLTGILQIGDWQIAPEIGAMVQFPLQSPERLCQLGFRRGVLPERADIFRQHKFGVLDRVARAVDATLSVLGVAETVVGLTDSFKPVRIAAGSIAEPGIRASAPRSPARPRSLNFARAFSRVGCSLLRRRHRMVTVLPVRLRAGARPGPTAEGRPSHQPRARLEGVTLAPASPASRLAVIHAIGDCEEVR